MGPGFPEEFLCAGPGSKFPTETICGPETSLATIGVAVVAEDTAVRLAVLRIVCPATRDLLLLMLPPVETILCC